MVQISQQFALLDQYIRLSPVSPSTRASVGKNEESDLIALICRLIWTCAVRICDNDTFHQTESIIVKQIIYAWKLIDCWGLKTHQPLWVILCCLPEKGRKQIEESSEDEREGQGRKRNRNESEEIEEIKHPLYPYLLQGEQVLPNCKPISVGRPGDVRYTTPSPHPTTPICLKTAFRHFFLLFSHILGSDYMELFLQYILRRCVNIVFHIMLAHLRKNVH